ncbi:MAG: hypothetical protein EBV05_09685 [Cyanobacteria bacterium WB6_1B_304]|nr:hypothetical protein [Cyanobacteria bacterium WB6_1B_304]
MDWIDPLADNKSRIELLAFLGGDLDIVNDARASFEKTSQQLNPQDIKLIHYLAKHQHTSPFRGTVFKFKVKAPLFICRQWWKHVIASNHNDEQLGWNEKSFRLIVIYIGNLRHFFEILPILPFLIDFFSRYPNLKPSKP